MKSVANGARISSIEKGSIADEAGLLVGDVILSVNENVPKDVFEYSFLEQEEELALLVRRGEGIGAEEGVFEIEKDYDTPLGISFESAVFDGVKPCANKCIFCFVDGQPKGLRPSLYVKDDDWRLSYLQGTYVTLTNLKEADWARIELIKPSPLYISIHTTNPDLRVQMLKNPAASRIMDDLTRLKALNIDFHAQIVLCPTFNDGKELERTVCDLKKFKNMLSLAVVPVGISKHHKNKLPKVDKKTALHTIKTLETLGGRAMASDEFFLIADLPVPQKKYYGKFHQIEDGVGAIRLYLDDFNKRKSKLKQKLKNPAKLTIITGVSAAPVFKQIKNEINVEGLELDIIEVKNDFFGEHIDVTGLIVGKDVLRSLENKNVKNLVIPSVMLKEGTEEFLDDVTLNDVRLKTNSKTHVIQDCYSFKELARIINSL